MEDNCPSCGHWSREGLQKMAERSKLHPIFGTDLNKDKSAVIEEIRSRICAARGAISDFQFAFPEWKGRTEPVEGLLTCGLVALYNVVQELEKFEGKRK